MFNLLVFDLGSLGPSTVTLIAFVYVATCGGELLIVIVNVKLLPENKQTNNKIIYIYKKKKSFPVFA